MCVKFPLGDLNTGPCPPHSTNTYICEVIITPRDCSGDNYITISINIFIQLINWFLTFS